LGRMASTKPELFAHWKAGFKPAVGWEEPYESRGSRTVLWEPRGEIPLCYSTQDSDRAKQIPHLGQHFRVTDFPFQTPREEVFLDPPKEWMYHLFQKVPNYGVLPKWTI
jgi:hypothetical protein